MIHCFEDGCFNVEKSCNIMLSIHEAQIFCESVVITLTRNILKLKIYLILECSFTSLMLQLRGHEQLCFLPFFYFKQHYHNNQIYLCAFNIFLSYKQHFKNNLVRLCTQLLFLFLFLFFQILVLPKSMLSFVNDLFCCIFCKNIVYVFVS